MLPLAPAALAGASSSTTVSATSIASSAASVAAVVAAIPAAASARVAAPARAPGGASVVMATTVATTATAATSATVVPPPLRSRSPLLLSRPAASALRAWSSWSSSGMGQNTTEEQRSRAVLKLFTSSVTTSERRWPFQVSARTRSTLRQQIGGRPMAAPAVALGRCVSPSSPGPR